MPNEGDGTPAEATSSVSGFWRRIGALAIDGAVLGACGAALGLALYDQLLGLGQAGRAIGFTIAIAYFGVLNSRLGSGQSLGKRALGIRVVDVEGQTIGPAAATLRAIILTLPWALNGLYVPATVSPLAEAGLYFAVFGVGGSILYLYVANRRSRQSLHDLAARTWVVRADSQVDPPSGLPRVHAVVVVLLLTASLLLPSLVFAPMSESPLMAGLQPLQASIQSAVDSPEVGVFRGTNRAVSTRGSGTTEFLRVTARLPRKVEDFERVANEIAAVVLAQDPQVESYDRIIVSLSYGFDILIARTSVSRSFSHTPEEWRHALE